MNKTQNIKFSVAILVFFTILLASNKIISFPRYAVVAKAGSTKEIYKQINSGNMIGRVTDKETGLPIANIAVSVWAIADNTCNLTGFTNVVRTDAQGLYNMTLCPGSYIILFENDGHEYAGQFYPGTTIRELAKPITIENDKTFTFDIQLSKQVYGWLVGRTYDVDKLFSVPNVKFTAFNGEGAKQANSDADGQFRVKLEPGVYEYDVSKDTIPMHRPVSEKTTFSIQGNTTTTFNIPLYFTRGWIVGTVTHPDTHQPISNTGVKFGDAYVKTDAQGKYTLMVEALQTAALGFIPPYESELGVITRPDISVASWETRTIDVALVKNGIVEGLVLDATTGAPIANAEIEAIDKNRYLFIANYFYPLYSPKTSTNVTGHFRVSLSPGQWELLISKGAEYVAKTVPTITLLSNQTVFISPTLSSRGLVSITVLDENTLAPIEGVTVGFRPVMSNITEVGSPGFTNKQGIASILVAEGEYFVGLSPASDNTIYADQWHDRSTLAAKPQAQTIQVKSHTTTSLVAKLRRSASISITTQVTSNFPLPTQYQTSPLTKFDLLDADTGKPATFTVDNDFYTKERFEVKRFLPGRYTLVPTFEFGNLKNHFLNVDNPFSRFYGYALSSDITVTTQPITISLKYDLSSFGTLCGKVNSSRDLMILHVFDTSGKMVATAQTNVYGQFCFYLPSASYRLVVTGENIHCYAPSSRGCNYLAISQLADFEPVEIPFSLAPKQKVELPDITPMLRNVKSKQYLPMLGWMLQ